MGNTDDARAKITELTGKLEVVVGELQRLEAERRYCDQQLCLQQAENELIAVATGLAVGGVEFDESMETFVTTTGASSADSTNTASSVRLACLARVVIARSIQGSASTLGVLVVEVQSVLARITKSVTDTPASSSDARDGVSDVLGVSLAAKQEALVVLGRLCDHVALSEEIKTVAERKEYGTRAKGALMFTDSNALAVWRWEAHSTGYFDKEAKGVMREARALRALYSRCLKSINKLMEQLRKAPLAHANVASLAEKVAKNSTEIEKAKEKRRLQAERAALAELGQQTTERSVIIMKAFLVTAPGA
ncbi:hypothetical protein B484DRAFT_473385, partial [Ochromonadaceae sp. CCMP2298]